MLPIAKLSAEEFTALPAWAQYDYIQILEEEKCMTSATFGQQFLKDANIEIEHGLDEEGVRVFNFLDTVLVASPGWNTPLSDIAGAVECFGTGFYPTDTELHSALYALKFLIEEGMVLDCDLI